MADKEKTMRAIGYLEGFSSMVWMFVGDKLGEEYAVGYDGAVETLRRFVCDSKEASDD